MNEVSNAVLYHVFFLSLTDQTMSGEVRSLLETYPAL